jgi:hypothetical protein
VLDKGLVIAGDITVFLGGVQLLTLKIRLLIASVDKAQEIGIDWWQSDPALSSRASARTKDLEQSEKERNLLTERLDRLERLLQAPPQEGDQEHAEAGQRSKEHAEAGRRSNAAPVLDQKSRLIAELKRPLEQAQGEEQPQPQARAPQQAEQPAGAGSLPGAALHECIAQAMRPVLEEFPQRIAQAQPTGRQDEAQRQEDEQPHATQRALQPDAAQAEQSAGAGPLLGAALHECIAQAMRPVLEGLPQWIAQAWQPGEQARPEG